MRVESGALVVFTLLVGACAPDRVRTPEGQWSYYERLLVQPGHSSTAPGPPRAHVPFELIYASDSEVFDSAAGTLLRYVPGAPPRTIRIELTAAERDTLWELLSISGFFDAPIHVGHDSRMIPGAFGGIRISVITDSFKHDVLWTPTLPELIETRGPHRRELDSQEPGLYAFDRRLARMLQQRAAYEALPRTLAY